MSACAISCQKLVSSSVRGAPPETGSRPCPRSPEAWCLRPPEAFAPKEKKTYSLILVVGSGVGDGDYVNRAWLSMAKSGSVVSNTATATVRIVPDPTFDCPDIIGKCSTIGTPTATRTRASPAFLACGWRHRTGC